MALILKRFGIRITRGYALLALLIGALIAAAFWIGPLRPVPAELRLFALTPGSRPVAELRMDSSRAVPSRTPGSAIRFPLVLAVGNEGATPARPSELHLSVPARFRLLDTKGEPLAGSRVAGNPLVRYRLEVKPGTISPGAAPVPLAYGDTLWLEPVLPDYYCTFITEGVPEFVPAPAYDPALIADVGIFYSFVAASAARQTGLLTVRIDPGLLKTDVVPMPPVFETTHGDPEAPRPLVAGLTQSGTRTEQCGDPDQSLELQSVLWETAQGGRVFVVHFQGTARKELYDLNRDGLIELEAWDADADGRFEASRRARFRTPSFLMPVPPAGSLADADPFRPDAGWLRNFYDIAAGPFRFLRTATDTAGAVQGGAEQGPPPGSTRPPVRRPDTTRASAPPVRTPALPPRTEGARTDPSGTADPTNQRPVTPPGAEARREPIRIFGMPVIRPPADSPRPDTIRQYR